METGSSLTDYAAVQDYLFGLKVKGVKFGIDRMRNLAEAIGHPQRKLPIIHIAGTNGKGSTAAMVESILRAAGKRVGLYTSPHLVRLGERVQVNRVSLTDDEIVAYTQELLPVAKELAKLGPDKHPSFFEFMTAMAFLQFVRKGCDVGIAEVGLGGELDATNVVSPTVTAITSIDLDHCDILGDSFAKIAQAKAGIIKPKVPVVIGRLPPEAEEVIRKKAAATQSRVVSVTEHYGSDLENYPEPSMAGDCQRINAATASLIVERLDPQIDERVQSIGFAQAQWPARWERIEIFGRKLILDSSHNSEGAAELSSNMARLLAREQRKPIVVVGALGAARATPLLEAASYGARDLHIVVPAQSRSCTHAELREIIPPSYSGPIYESNVSQLFGGKGIETWSNRGDTIVVTGSIYLAGEVLAEISSSSESLESHFQDF